MMLWDDNIVVCVVFCVKTMCKIINNLPQPFKDCPKF